MSTRAVAAALLATVAVTASACSGGSGGRSASRPVTPSRSATRYPSSVAEQQVGDGAVHLVVATSKAPAAPGLAAQAAGDEVAFALALTRTLYGDGSGGGNVLTSPLSADVALSMLLQGARGATAAAIAGALQEPESSAAAAGTAWGALLSSLGTGLGPAHLNIADSVWLQDGVPFVPAYLSTLAGDFGNAAYQADFRDDMPGAVAAVNHWVATETAGRITHLLEPGSLDPSTIAVLANALHFKASWDSSLSFESATEPFHTSTGQTVEVPAMSDDPAGVESLQNGAVTAVELPYAGGRFSALLLEPAGSISQYLSQLTPATLTGILGSLRRRLVSLELPTLSLSSSLSMRSALSGLGMGLAFAPTADLSGISPEAANVGAVVQANRLDVTTWGTDFASATAIGIVPSVIVDAAPLHIDHPYLFMIRDDDTGAILASAVVDNPLAAA